jgi:hypothetical protein
MWSFFYSFCLAVVLVFLNTILSLILWIICNKKSLFFAMETTIFRSCCLRYSVIGKAIILQGCMGHDIRDGRWKPSGYNLCCCCCAKCSLHIEYPQHKYFYFYDSFPCSQNDNFIMSTLKLEQINAHSIKFLITLVSCL